LSVSFKVQYTSPCGSFFLDSVGPVLIQAGAVKNANLQFHVPKDACTGLYRFTVKAYVGGVLVGTTTADLTVISTPSPLSQNRSDRTADSTIRLD